MKNEEKILVHSSLGKRDSPIITIEASNVKEARKKILLELSKNPSRTSYLSNWLNSNQKLIKKKPW